MLSDRLETFTSELLSRSSIHFRSLWRHCFTEHSIRITHFLGIGGACANSWYQAHLQCGLGSRLKKVLEYYRRGNLYVVCENEWIDVIYFKCCYGNSWCLNDWSTRIDKYFAFPVKGVNLQRGRSSQWLLLLAVSAFFLALAIALQCKANS